MRELSDHTLEQELAIVAALRHVGAATGPQPDEVDRMRQRVMAGFAEADLTGSDAGPKVALLPTGRTAARRRGRTSVGAEARGRIVVAAAAALCLLMSLSGMSLLLSRDAVPGDALYGVKRSAESAELGLTFGMESRARKHLEFAAARLDEIEVLAAENAASADLVDEFLAVFDDFDTDAMAGARMLTTVAASGDGTVLPGLLGWIEQQQTRLDGLRAALPADLESRLSSSLDLLARLEDRVTALQERAECTAVATGSSDALGSMPADGPCVPAPLDDPAVAAPQPGDARPTDRPTPDVSPAAPGSASGSPAPRAPASGVQPPAAAPDAQTEPQRPRLSDVLRPPSETQQPDSPGAGGPSALPRLILPLPMPELPALPEMLPEVPEVPELPEAPEGPEGAEDAPQAAEDADVRQAPDPRLR